MTGRLTSGGSQFQASLGRGCTVMGGIHEIQSQEEKKLGLVVHTCHTSYGGKHKIGGWCGGSCQPRQKPDPILKIAREKSLESRFKQ
jgi:hypothetical protein